MRRGIRSVGLTATFLKKVPVKIFFSWWGRGLEIAFFTLSQRIREIKKLLIPGPVLISPENWLFVRRPWRWKYFDNPKKYSIQGDRKYQYKKNTTPEQILNFLSVSKIRKNVLETGKAPMRLSGREAWEKSHAGSDEKGKPFISARSASYRRIRHEPEKSASPNGS